MVQNMPTLLDRDQPVVAIITRLYCEKLAVDAMIDNKITYVRYKTEGKYCSRITQWRIQHFPERRCQPTIWPIFSRKLHEN